MKRVKKEGKIKRDKEVKTFTEGGARHGLMM
jgi:hypothetical protein